MPHVFMVDKDYYLSMEGKSEVDAIIYKQNVALRVNDSITLTPIDATPNEPARSYILTGLKRNTPSEGYHTLHLELLNKEK